MEGDDLKTDHSKDECQGAHEKGCANGLKQGLKVQKRIQYVGRDILYVLSLKRCCVSKVYFKLVSGRCSISPMSDLSNVDILFVRIKDKRILELMTMMNLFQLQESLDNDATVDKIELQRKRLQIGIREGKQILTTHQVNISFYLNQSQD